MGCHDGRIHRRAAGLIQKDRRRTMNRTHSERLEQGAWKIIAVVILGPFMSQMEMCIRDSNKTAFLTLDLQKGIFGLVPDSERVMPVAAKVVAFARQNQFRIIHVGLGFSKGHPEIPDFESPFLRVKQNNLFVKGTASAEFHGDIFHPDDLSLIHI